MLDGGVPRANLADVMEWRNAVLAKDKTITGR